MGWMMPNQFLTHVWEGNDPELWTEMKEFNTNAKVSKASGFSFDSTNVIIDEKKAQLAAWQEANK